MVESGRSELKTKVTYSALFSPAGKQFVLTNDHIVINSVQPATGCFPWDLHRRRSRKVKAPPL